MREMARENIRRALRLAISLCILHFSSYGFAATPREMIDAIYKPGQNPQGSNPAPIKMDVSGESWAKMSPDAFLPCFDTYGQFKWRDWPGKTKTDGDLKRAAADEADDLAAHPGPADRDRFGGWAAGPQLKATGRFRTEKVDGKWWLVDPDGRLFWSFGPVRVSTGCGITPLDVGAQPWRRRMFDSLPSGDGPGKRTWSTSPPPIFSASMAKGGSTQSPIGLTVV